MTDHTSLAAAKFAFIEAIACDPSVSALDLRVNTLLISRYLNSERGRAVDETGGQMAIFGRLGSRPFTLEEMQKLYLDENGEPWFVPAATRR